MLAYLVILLALAGGLVGAFQMRRRTAIRRRARRRHAAHIFIQTPDRDE